MKNSRTNSRLWRWLSAALLIAFSSCKKDWLDIKPNNSTVVVSSFSDFQGLMDNPNVCLLYPNIGEIGSDNILIAPNFLVSQSALNISSYLWAKDGWPQSSIGSWTIPYQSVLYCNTVLEGLGKIEQNSANELSWKKLYGTALFHRGTAFFNLASLFAQPFDKMTSNQALGIPIRLETDANAKMSRGTVQETYDRILMDLKSAAQYLPTTSEYKIRPTKQAAYGMLARVYLAMEIFDSAYRYADMYLQVSKTLLDYNTLPLTATISMSSYNLNPEVIFHAALQGSTALTQTRTDVDTDLFNSYNNNDLRKTAFYRQMSGRNVWKGSYSSSLTRQFSGIATDEIYLIRAECLARAGQTAASMDDLNTLMKTRWRTGTFVTITATDANDALRKILVERQKEIVYRGIRWTDLRRLNRDNAFKKTLSRMYNNQMFSLIPGDNKYVWPIPDDEIMYSGIQQNPR